MKNDIFSKVKRVKIRGSDHEKWQNLYKLLSLSGVIEFEIDVNNLKSKT